MKLQDFHYDVPAGTIAQAPVSPRDHSRLMVLDRNQGTLNHDYFFGLDEHLRPGDLLVTNATKVFPARLRGTKVSGGKVEVLLLAQEDASWKALVRGATQKTTLQFPEGLRAEMSERLAEGEWRLMFSSNHIRSYLDRHGEMPLPPYIKRNSVNLADVERYQTVYARTEGAVAAPTAGFHFTEDLLRRLTSRGIETTSLVLHVGWGTFRPVRTKTIEEHPMLSEMYEVSADTAKALNRAKQEGRRLIAVGTTVTRTLETICDASGTFSSGRGEAKLYIYPGYRFKAVDALITNFHLPGSTPLLLACAFYSDRTGVTGYRSIGVRADVTPIPRNSDTPIPPFSLRPAYEVAIQRGYRFYSYGDAMLIL